MRSAGRRYRRHEQGLALVMTLFVVSLVTVLVLEYHFDAAVEIDLAMNYASDVQAYHLAMAGVRFAQGLLQRDDPKADGPDDSWYKLGLVPACFSPQQLLELATTGGGEALPSAAPDTRVSADRPIEEVSQSNVGCVSLRITDEDSKLPINALMPPKGDENQLPPAVWVSIFQKFFESFKIDPEVVEALVDWIDEGENPRGTNGAEKSYYTSLPIPYEPPNQRMRTPGELRLVKGLDNPETLAKLFPGATLEAVADLDLGSNNYLTPFGAEQTQLGTQPTNPSTPQVPNRPGTQVPTQTGAGSGRVNVNTASAEVLKALITGVQPDRSTADAEVQEIVEKRQIKQFASLNEMPDANLRTRLNQVAGVQSTYFRIESVGVVGIVRKKIVAVLKRPSQQTSQLSQSSQANQSTIRYFKVE